MRQWPRRFCAWCSQQQSKQRRWQASNSRAVSTRSSPPLQRDRQPPRYTAQRAQKQSAQIDPDNRLVADELERRWNQALLRVREVESQIEQHHRRQDQVAIPSAEEFAELGADLEAVWN